MNLSALIVLLPREESFFNKFFSNLDSVCRCSLAEIVSNAPEVQTVFYRRVPADTSYEDIVLTPGIERHRIDVVCRIVLKGHARSLFHNPADILKSEVFFEFEVDALTVAGEYTL